MASFEFLAVVLSVLGLSVSIIYYANVMKNANKTQQMQQETRQIQLFMQIYDDVNTKENLETFAELTTMDIENEENLQKYDPSVNPSLFAKRARLWYSYNTIGELLRDNIIELDLLHRLNVDINVIVMWEIWEGIIKKNRETQNMPDLWDGFEFLYDEMKKIREHKGFPDIKYNPLILSKKS